MARRLAMCESVTGKAMETQPMQPMGSPMFFDVTNILDIRFLFPFPIGSELLDAIWPFALLAQALGEAFGTKLTIGSKLASQIL